MFRDLNEIPPIWAWNIMLRGQNLGFDYREYAVEDVVSVDFSRYLLFTDFVAGRQDLLVGDGY
jgi:hypothetical protein